MDTTNGCKVSGCGKWVWHHDLHKRWQSYLKRTPHLHPVAYTGSIRVQEVGIVKGKEQEVGIVKRNIPMVLGFLYG